MYLYLYIYISCSYLNDVLFSILKPPFFFTPPNTQQNTNVADGEDHELHDLTVAVTRTKHRLSGAISLLMEALQELKDKGGRGRLEMGDWRTNSMCVYYNIYI